METELESTQEQVKAIIDNKSPSYIIDERLRKVVEDAGKEESKTKEEIEEELEITDSTDEALEQMDSDEIPEDYLINTRPR
jgi:hypothetical protein